MASQENDLVRASRRAGIYYVGSFDDEILRHNSAAFNLQSINETLSQAALFGGPLLINDGSLMLSHAGRQALTEANRSPLTSLLETGYVKLYSRNGGDLAAMPVEMQDIVPTYRDLLASDNWSGLRDRLLRLQGSDRYSTMYEPWPAVNFGPGFQKLLNTALTKLRPDQFSGITDSMLSKIQDEFNSRMNSNPLAAARSTWRSVCESEEFRLPSIARSQLHWLGLEAYHYNLAMISSLNQPRRQPGVLTRYSHLFTELRDTQIHQKGGDTVETGARLQDIPAPVVPRSLIARGALHDGSLLAEAVCSGSRLHSAKMKYLEAVDAALSDKDELPAAAAAAEQYGDEIKRSAGTNESGDRDKLLVAVKLLAKSAGTFYLGHQLGHGFSGYLAGAAMEHGLEEGAAWIARKFETQAGIFTTPLAVDMLDPLPDFEGDTHALRTSAQGTEWFAFLGIEREKALDHARLLPALEAP